MFPRLVPGKASHFCLLFSQPAWDSSSQAGVGRHGARISSRQSIIRIWVSRPGYLIASSWNWLTAVPHTVSPAQVLIWKTQ